MSVLPQKQCRSVPTQASRSFLWQGGRGGPALVRSAHPPSGRRGCGVRALLVGLLAGLLAGCGLFTSLPEPSTTTQRLEVLSSMPKPPFDGAVTIYWDEHMIPFITAESDKDAALALGLVHAHLRLGQLEVFKRAAGGRLSELLSKFGTPYDEAIRAVNYYRVANEIIATMPVATRQWLTAYVAGINHYKKHIGELPHDMIIGDMENEPWTIQDSIAIGKLISSDINWMTLGALLKLREEDNWPQLFGQLMSHDEGLQPSFPVSLPEVSLYPHDGEMHTDALGRPDGLHGFGSFGGFGEGAYSSFKDSDASGGAGDFVSGGAGDIGGSGVEPTQALASLTTSRKGDHGATRLQDRIVTESQARAPRAPLGISAAQARKPVHGHVPTRARVLAQPQTSSSSPRPSSPSPSSLGSLPWVGDDATDLDKFSAVLSNFARFGSNSLVVSGERSTSGAPIMVNEPHLGFVLPNLWVLVGIHSPGYRVVGMMVPGTPIIALGRNRHVSWGGTNMRAYSSDIVEVTGEPMTEEVHKIVRRKVRDSTVKNRMSEIGPVISDVDLFEFPKGRDFALRWTGHLISDEMTSYLGIMRAGGWREMKTALASYGVPGLNLVFADQDGTIGQFSAGWLPSRPLGAPTDIWTDRATSDLAWGTMLTTDDLPWVVNPPGGVVASANNPPTSSPPTRMAWTYPRDDRIRRMYKLVQTREKWDIAGLQAVNGDTYSRSHHRLNQMIVRVAESVPERLDADARAVLATLREWDGRFDVDSKGAYVHIGVVEELFDELYDELDRDDELKLWWGSTFLPNRLSLDLEAATGVRLGEGVGGGDGGLGDGVGSAGEGGGVSGGVGAGVGVSVGAGADAGVSVGAGAGAGAGVSAGVSAGADADASASVSGDAGTDAASAGTDAGVDVGDASVSGVKKTVGTDGSSEEISGLEKSAVADEEGGAGGETQDDAGGARKYAQARALPDEPNPKWQEELSRDEVLEIVIEALSDMDSLAENDKVWGDVHRLRVGYIALQSPIGGKKYILDEISVPGGTETLQKSAHSLTADKHYAYFGTQSRHYSDMSDDDENYFVLYGGQDGWLNAENFADQVKMWAEGDLIRIPLRLETVRETFPHRTVYD